MSLDSDIELGAVDLHDSGLVMCGEHDYFLHIDDDEYVYTYKTDAYQCVIGNDIDYATCDDMYVYVLYDDNTFKYYDYDTCAELGSISGITHSGTSYYGLVFYDSVFIGNQLINPFSDEVKDTSVYTYDFCTKATDLYSTSYSNYYICYDKNTRLSLLRFDTDVTTTTTTSTTTTTTIVTTTSSGATTSTTYSTLPLPSYPTGSTGSDDLSDEREIGTTEGQTNMTNFMDLVLSCFPLLILFIFMYGLTGDKR